MLPIVPRALDFARTAVKQIGIPLVVKAVSLVEARDVADILMGRGLAVSVGQPDMAGAFFVEAISCNIAEG